MNSSIPTEKNQAEISPILDLIEAWKQDNVSPSRTNADIRKTVHFCLTHPDIRCWSNRQIARWCGVYHTTIANYDARMLADGAMSNRPAKVKFIDKHGNISLRKRSFPRPKPLPKSERRGIYIFTNAVKGWQYVGQSMNMSERIMRCYTGYGHNSLLYSDLCAYPDHFSVEAIDLPCLYEGELRSLEFCYIHVLNTRYPEGYNLSA